MLFFPYKKIILFLAFVILIFYFLFFTAPKDFPAGQVFNITEGSGLRTVSLNLKEAQIIRSRIIFEAFVIIYGGDRHIAWGDYLFEKKLPVFKIAGRISDGKYNIAPIAVVVPEGFDVSEIADAFALKLKNFDKNNFLAEAQNKEGYLFPDTYFFFTTDNEEKALKAMSDNFEKKIEPIRPEIIASGKTEEEIITMASIIEKEAKGDADRAIISGILWNRISAGMPLQVDAAPDTYKTKGLPDSPICNPGLESIKAAIYPAESKYLYYLHDKEGIIHYARTFEEHRKNVIKYLK